MPSPHNARLAADTPVVQRAGEQHRLVQPVGAGKQDHVVAAGVGDAVDALLAQAEAAGASLTAPPRDRPWGIYSGYFRDPDGHLWEIMWNPALDLG
jgi:uncharacterized glyoxalase superfamily protein PhnB